MKREYLAESDLNWAACNMGTSVQNARVKELLDFGWRVKSVRHFGLAAVVGLFRDKATVGLNGATLMAVLPDGQTLRPPKNRKSVTYSLSAVQHLYNLHKG